MDDFRARKSSTSPEFGNGSVLKRRPQGRQSALGYSEIPSSGLRTRAAAFSMTCVPARRDRGAHVIVSEKLLYGAKILSHFQEMRGKGMP